jgi:hypothetical protein
MLNVFMRCGCVCIFVCVPKKDEAAELNLEGNDSPAAMQVKTYIHTYIHPYIHIYIPVQ